jgi:hypothetical protein
LEKEKENNEIWVDKKRIMDGVLKASNTLSIYAQ